MPIGVGILVHVVRVFEFQCRMTDIEFLLQSLFYPVLDTLKLIPCTYLDNYMGLQRCLVFAHLPKMYVVKIDNAFDIGQGNNDSIGIDIHRAAQHEGSDGAADFCQTQVENIEGNADGDGRINPAHVVE